MADEPRNFASTEELASVLREKISSSYPVIENAVKEIRVPLVAQLKRLIVPGILTVFSFIILDAMLVGWLAGIGFFAFAAWLAMETYRLVKLYETYVRSLDLEVYKIVFTLFKIEATHTKGDADTLKRELAMSELLTEKVHNHGVDDDIDTIYKGQPLSITELCATRSEGSGKNRRTVTVFQGVFVSHKLPAEFSSETYVSTEGDKYGFGHRGFWSNLVGLEKVEETEFEWNQFEKDLHVATSDPTEARYILTPDFMQELHDWWRKGERNIRISFKNSHCYMLFPDKKVSVGKVPFLLNEQRINDYCYTIAEPIWHVFNLLDDVRTRFR